MSTLMEHLRNYGAWAEPTPEKMRIIVEVIKLARLRVSDPTRWCRDFSERDAKGQPITTIYPSTRACSWCAQGAIDSDLYQVVGKNLFLKHRHLAVLATDYALKTLTLVGINDNPQTTHAKLMSTFDQIISTIERELAA